MEDARELAAGRLATTLGTWRLEDWGRRSRLSGWKIGYDAGENQLEEWGRRWRVRGWKIGDYVGELAAGVLGLW